MKDNHTLAVEAGARLKEAREKARQKGWRSQSDKKGEAFQKLKGVLNGVGLTDEELELIFGPKLSRLFNLRQERKK